MAPAAELASEPRSVSQLRNDVRRKTVVAKLSALGPADIVEFVVNGLSICALATAVALAFVIGVAGSLANASEPSAGDMMMIMAERMARGTKLEQK
ncbi:hypothetical protein AZE99_09840 [Sphingorhabdus sp. M41]|nr:hypothetical protein AZE99_09840 [Sphingorhabdus sp. M41]